MAASNQWILFALGSAFFAALTAIFGKLGVAEINSNLATFIRTIVIVIMMGIIVASYHQWEPLANISKFGMLALVLSAIATGLSWLCYYRALQLAPASQVAPIDKLSVVFVVIFAVILLGEKLTWKVALGSLLITSGAVVMVL